MAADRRDVRGTWYGMMVHHPSRGVIRVTLTGSGRSYTGKWTFPKLARGNAREGEFKAIRFANWLDIRITTPPLSNVQCQLTIVEDKGESVITGVIPLEKAKIPFATVTLFRHAPGEEEMAGVCPLFEFFPRRPR